MLRVSGGISDEGFSGSRVRDTGNQNRFTRQGADFLSSAIRTASQPVKSNTTSNRAAISQSTGSIAKALGENTEAVQKILDSGDSTRDEFVNLTKMLSASQQKTGEASVAAIKQLIKQIEKIKISAGDKAGELVSNLNLGDTQEVLKKQLEPLGFLGTAFKKFTNVDLREGKMSDAFSKSALLGNGPSADSQVNTLAAEVAQGDQAQNLNDTASALSNPDFVTPSMTPNTENAQGGDAFSTGIDRESFDSQQVELEEKQVVLLTDILKELEKNTQTTESKGGGVVDTVLNAAGGTGLAVGAKKLFDRVRGRTPTPSPNVTTPTIDNKPRVTAPTIDGKPRVTDPNLLDRNGKPLQGAALNSRQKKLEKEAAEAAAKKAATRTASRGFGKSLLKKIPGVSLVAGGLFAAQRAMAGDWKGAGLELASGAAGTIPGFGTAASTAIDAGLMARDMGAFEGDTSVEEAVQPTVRRRNRGPGDQRNQQSIEPDFLPGPGTNPLDVGSGVYSADAQGLSPNVVPTGDAVGNMSDAYQEKVSNVINNINNITNNNTSGGGSQSSPVLVNPPSIRNPNNSFIDFQYRQFTRI